MNTQPTSTLAAVAPATPCSARHYEYGELTEEYLKALPEKPMSAGEWFGDSKAAKRCRQLSACYGSISGGALQEAIRIKYSSQNAKTEPRL